MPQVKPHGFVWSGDVGRFNELAPAIHWQPMPPPDALRKHLIAEATRGKTGLTLFYVRFPAVHILARKGWIQPVEALMPDGFFQRYLPQVLRHLTTEGNLFAFPEDWSVYGQFCLKDAPAPPARTWNDVLSMSGKPLTSRGSRKSATKREPAACFRVPCLALADRNVFTWTLLKSNGLDARLINEPELAAPQALLEAHAFASTLSCAGCLDGVKQPAPMRLPGKTQRHTLFRHVLTDLHHSLVDWYKPVASALFQQREELLFQPFPQGEHGLGPAVPVSGSAWCVPRNSAFPEIAAEAMLRLHDEADVLTHAREGGGGISPFHCVFHDKQVRRLHPYHASLDAVLGPDTCRTVELETHELNRLQTSLFASLKHKESANDWLEILCRQAQPDALAAGDRRLRTALRHIETNLGTLRGIEDIASVASLSANHLNRLFTREKGMTCWAWVVRRKMEHALELLDHSSLSIKQTAGMLGFSSLQTFTRAFRNHFQKSPTEYRKGRSQKFEV